MKIPKLRSLVPRGLFLELFENPKIRVFGSPRLFLGILAGHFGGKIKGERKQMVEVDQIISGSPRLVLGIFVRHFGGKINGERKEVAEVDQIIGSPRLVLGIFAGHFVGQIK